MLCEQAAALAASGEHAIAVAKFEQALFYRPDYAEGHEMRAQACCSLSCDRCIPTTGPPSIDIEHAKTCTGHVYGVGQYDESQLKCVATGAHGDGEAV